MTDIILHHYETSPYSEKVRLGFGLKGLAWQSVEIPAIMDQSAAMIAQMSVVDAVLHTLESRMIGHCGFSVGDFIAFPSPSP